MKEYLVVSDYGQWNNMWIVSARNAKDAIELVYRIYIVPMNEVIRRENNKEAHFQHCRCCRKDELHADSIGILHKREGKVIVVN